MSNLIANASELLNRTKKLKGTSKDFMKLKEGEGFMTTAKKVQGLRILAAKNGRKLAARRQPNGTFLVCRIK